MSVSAKSLPLYSSGSRVASASAYAKQSPKFSPAGVVPLAEPTPGPPRRLRMLDGDRHKLDAGFL